MIGWLEHPVLKWLLPIPMLAGIAPLIYLFFRKTWRELEEGALAWRQELAAAGRTDYRPLLTLTLGTLVLAMQEYYGQLPFFQQRIAPWLAQTFGGAGEPSVGAHLSTVREHLALYAELYGRMWWALSRIAGYTLPYLVWRFAFPKDSLKDMGLRFAGFREHAWLYAFFVVVMVPILLIVSRQPDFGAYYPICSTAGRSWAEFIAWETVYVGQFIGLEMFFRGWWIRTTRIFGTGAIFSMIVPYCMIHFGKPYLEVCSALIAGVVLGSLSIRTRSIWAGVSVHVTVALLNDVLALEHKGQLPRKLTALSSHELQFHHWRTIIWAVWAFAFLVLVVKAVRVWPALRRRLAPRA